MEDIRTARVVATLRYVAAIMVATFATGNAVGPVAAVGAVLLAAFWVVTSRMAANRSGVDRRPERAQRRSDHV